uniref:Putative secreted protein n=1 Tax=Anopheles triannulatus TaxID=58253 RepID=A0A2M4B1C5_9DIPT
MVTRLVEIAAIVPFLPATADSWTWNCSGRFRMKRNRSTRQWKRKPRVLVSRAHWNRTNNSSTSTTSKSTKKRDLWYRRKQLAAIMTLARYYLADRRW